MFDLINLTRKNAVEAARQNKALRQEVDNLRQYLGLPALEHEFSAGDLRQHLAGLRQRAARKIDPNEKLSGITLGEWRKGN